MFDHFLFVLILLCVPEIFSVSSLHHQEVLGSKYSGSLMKVETVQGMLANLPCNITPSLSNDRVLLVLWYKDGLGNPIYTFDLRQSPAHESIIVSKESNGRAHLNINHQPMSFLSILGVEENDQGEYYCRVDFKFSPTRYQTINLYVVVPPKVAVIYQPGREYAESPGPFRLNHTNILYCDVIGGHPASSVRWYRRGSMIDGTWKEIAPGKSRNILQTEFSRDMFNTQIECRGSNNNHTNPVVRTMNVKILLPPLSVEIGRIPSTLSSGRQYTVECTSRGSNPPPTISWRILGQSTSLLGAKQTNLGDRLTSISQLKYSPRDVDEGKTLVCSAENSAVNSTVQTSTLLNISSVPRVTLEFGSTIQKSEIKEGDDVYLNCRISAYPQSYKQSWYFKGEQITDDSSGYMLHENSVVIRNISRNMQGEYSCSATNSEGTGFSNTVKIPVKYRPTCKHPEENIVVKKGDRVILTCPVIANPEPTDFRWSSTFGGSPLEKLTPTASIEFTPTSDAHFGALTCWAENSLGVQSVPCILHLIHSGVPEPVKECRTNISQANVMISCVPGFVGTSTSSSSSSTPSQHFILRLSLSADTKFNRIQLVSSKSPFFIVKDLPPGARLTGSVVSVNENGESSPTDLILHIPVNHGLQRQVKDRGGKVEVTWILAALLTILVLGTLLTGIVIRIIVLHVQSRRREVDRPSASSRMEDTQLTDMTGSLHSYEAGTTGGNGRGHRSASQEDLILHSERFHVSPFFTLPRRPQQFYLTCPGHTSYGSPLAFNSPFHQPKEVDFAMEAVVLQSPDQRSLDEDVAL